MNRLRLGMLSLAGFVWMGCSSATTNPIGTGGGQGNTGGAVGNTGGVVGNTGGVGPSTGGVGPGTGGVVTGTGGVVTGTGGVVTGTGGVVAGTGGGNTAACEAVATNNGYMDNGTLCGYAWTATNGQGETIDPPCEVGDGSDCFMGATLCATAELPPNDPDNDVYTGAMIGWNVGQPSGVSTPGTWTSSGAGITPTFTATGATGEVRVIVQSGGTDYCAPMATSGAPLAWSDFATECWGTTGTAFTAGSPITAIVVQVNGADVAQSVSALCLTGITVN